MSSFVGKAALVYVMAPDSAFACPGYVASDGKRCRHYAEHRCGLTDGAPCVEWLTANGEPIPSDHPLVERDLLGELILRSSKPAPALSSSPPPATPEASDVTPCRYCMRGEHIESFKRLGLEVHLVYDHGDLWLVHEYRDSSRVELSVDDAATLFLLVSSFPGAKVESFRKLS